MRSMIFTLLLLCAMVAGCGNNSEEDNTGPGPAFVDSSIYENESYAVDTFHNKHLKYDNP